jgi:FAD/FMN-containing dehydrogenase
MAASRGLSQERAVPPESVPLNYGENYPRLVRVKNKYDPSNLFRRNANVAPTVT